MQYHDPMVERLHWKRIADTVKACLIASVQGDHRTEHVAALADLWERTRAIAASVAVAAAEPDDGGGGPSGGA